MNVKARSAARCVFGKYGAFVFFNDAVTYSEPESCPLACGLSGKKRLEYLVEDVLGNPRACIGNFKLYEFGGVIFEQPGSKVTLPFFSIASAALISKFKKTCWIWLGSMFTSGSELSS